MTKINTEAGALRDNPESTHLVRPLDESLNDLTAAQTTLRFAVATFDTDDGLRHALDQLSRGGLQPETFNCLTQKRVLVSAAGLARWPIAEVEELTFPENADTICCTQGLLAQRFVELRRAGARSLKDALNHWLIPRHAAELQRAVEGGRLVLWVQLLDSESERTACQSLLAGSSNSVGVHDLVAT